MTLVVGVNLKRGAIITADSRITFRLKDHPETHADYCQKIFRIGKKTISGVSGNLNSIVVVLTVLEKMFHHNPDEMNVESLYENLPKILKKESNNFFNETNNKLNIGLIVAGRRNQNNFQTFICKSPDFDPKIISINQFGTVGSGTPLIESIADDLRFNIPFWATDLGDSIPHKFSPEIIGTLFPFFIESRIKKSNIPTVGRVYHTHYINSDGVWPIPYEINRIHKKDDNTFDKKTILGSKIGDKGQWILYNGEGKEFELKSPFELLKKFYSQVEDDDIL
jgi:hypothetical protein